ncbi:energy transducer TonB [Labilibaculum euxinus]
MRFKSRLTYRNFIDYFSNKLEKKEKHAFEKKMMQDAFDSEAFDGLSKISSQELEQDFAELKNKIHARTQERKRRIPIWFPYAASIVILIGLGSVLIYLNQYSVQNEMIGSQMESEVKKAEVPVVQPELPAKKSELLDIIDTLKEDSELEFSDSGDSEVQEFAEVEDEEVDEEIETFSKPEILSEAPVANKKMSVNRITKSADADLERRLEIEKALSGKVAGLEVSKQKKQEEPLAFHADSSKKDINRMINGVVLDEDEVPIPGVQIFSKETGEGVVTNMDGQFQINANDTNKTYKLTASFIGYEQKEINAQADSTLLVILESDEVSMDEAVVVAYGSDGDQLENSNNSWEKARPANSASISNFKKVLIEKLDYSKFEHLHGAYKLKLSFIITASGTVDEIVFKDKPDFVLVSEIENLLRSGENWEPAKSRGIPVSSKVRMVLKLHFE